MHFGEPLDDERLLALLRPGERHRHGASPPTPTARARPTGCSAARCAGVPRDAYCLVGAVGHDFYEGEREGAKGFPRFTDPRLRGPERLRATTCAWPPSAASSASAPTRFDLLLLHNPDRTGYTQRGGVGGHGGAARRRA